MSIIVMKFGGTSVADLACMERVADKVAAEQARGNQVVVVTSAQSGVTNTLEQKLFEAAGTENPDPMLYDAAVSIGENQAAALLTAVLRKRGMQARSWNGTQIPVCCEGHHRKARIGDIDAQKLKDDLDRGNVAVVTGFQGVMNDGNVATLGRGGSDTSAVALAAALGARCDIYTDVNGVCTADPRIVNKAQLMPYISYEEALELASLGSKVLQTRSVELALKYGVPVQVLSSFEEGTIGSDLPGTLVLGEAHIEQKNIVTGITSSVAESLITISEIPDEPGIASLIFEPLAKRGIPVDMIIQNAPNGEKARIAFTVPHNEIGQAVKAIKAQRKLNGIDIKTEEALGKVSIVGAGMKDNTGVASAMFDILAKNGINVVSSTTSPIGVSVLVDKDMVELAIRKLHTGFGLDAIKREFNPMGCGCDTAYDTQSGKRGITPSAITGDGTLKSVTERQVVSQMTIDDNVGRLTVSDLPNVPGVGAKLLGALAERGINVDVINQNTPGGAQGTLARMTITVPSDRLEEAVDAIYTPEGFEDVKVTHDGAMAQVSLVGIGMKSHTDVVQTVFNTLGDAEVNIRAISASEVSLGLLVDKSLVHITHQRLQRAFDLDAERGSKQTPCNTMQFS